MGYTEYLKALLAPLGVYELDDGYGAAEIRALGEALDSCGAVFDDCRRESVIQSAESFGLENYEALMPYVPAYSDLRSRRGALMALLQTDGQCFTVEALNRTLSGCGIPAVVEETDIWYTVLVRFPGLTGLPPQFEAVKQRIGQILPCHLNIRYDLKLTCWSDLEAAFATMAAPLEDKMTFADLETYRLPA